MTTPFFAAPDSTATITVGAASANVQIPNSASGAGQVRVRNRGTADVWFRFGGDNTVTADMTNDMSIGAGGVEIFTLPQNAGNAWVAAIAVGATGVVEFTAGSGI